MNATEVLPVMADQAFHCMSLLTSKPVRLGLFELSPHETWFSFNMVIWLCCKEASSFLTEGGVKQCP